MGQLWLWCQTLEKTSHVLKKEQEIESAYEVCMVTL